MRGIRKYKIVDRSWSKSYIRRHWQKNCGSQLFGIFFFSELFSWPVLPQPIIFTNLDNYFLLCLLITISHNLYVLLYYYLGKGLDPKLLHPYQSLPAGDLYMEQLVIFWIVTREEVSPLFMKNASIHEWACVIEKTRF